MSVSTQAPATNKYSGANAPPVPDATVLVPPHTPLSTFTARRDTDTRTAVTRGVAEYISDVVVEADDGRQVRFRRVFDSWSEPEEGALYPSAIAYTTNNGIYDASKFTPTVNPKCRIPAPDGRYLISPAEYVVDVVVEVWATDPIERRLLVMALEDAFNPFTGQYGFTLQLPHYHNVRSTFEPMQMGYMDSEAAAIRRDRRAVFVLSARVPLIRLASFPGAKPRVNVAAVGPDVVVDGTVPC